MVISAVIMGNCAITYGMPTPIAILAGMIVRWRMCGLLNGFLVANMKLPPFIVTLGTWNIVMATNFIYSANETIRDTDVDEQAPLLAFLRASASGSAGAVLTLGVIAMVLLVVVLWYVLNHTAWGRHVYAVGDDPEAAKLSGIQTKKVLLAVYGVPGLIAAFAAWVSIGRNGSISPSSAVTDFNLQAITATVIGGISLFGGRGSILGTLFGAMIVGVVSMGLNMLGADPQWKVLLTGVLIIAAVAHRSVDQKGIGMTMTGEPILTARGLVKRYGRVTALDNADFDLYPGEILAVIGDNGAGKSSLIKAISGATTPDEGEITPGGQTGPLHDRRWRRARPASRPSTRTWRCRRRCRSPTTCSSAAKSANPASSAPGLPHARPADDGKDRPRQALRTRPDDDPEHQPGGGNALRRPAPGRGGGASRRLRFQSDHHGRADGSARRQGKPQGAGTDPRRARPRPADRADLAQHAACLRGGRPHPYPPARASPLTVINPKEYTMSDAVAFMTGAKVPPGRLSPHDDDA